MVSRLTMRERQGRWIIYLESFTSKHRPSSVDFGPYGPCLAISCTPAFRVAPSLYFLVCGRDLLVQSAPARQARIPSRVRSLWSMLFRPQQGFRRVKRLCQANTSSPAYQVSVGRRASVPASPHALCPAGARQRRDGMRPRRCPAASWSPCETPLRLYPNARRQSKPSLIPGAVQESPGAGWPVRSRKLSQLKNQNVLLRPPLREFVPDFVL